MKQTRVSIVGLGLIGLQRLEAARHLGYLIESTYDPLKKKLANCQSLDDVLLDKSDLVVVATPHSESIWILNHLLQSNKHILVEKPLGRNYEEFIEFWTMQAVNRSRIHVGLNYPYFEGIASLISDVQTNRFGNILRIRAQMGHGGSPQDKTSWKLDPTAAGGGCILDPGIHLLDLICTISGTVPTVHSVHISRGFWETGIEEQAICVLSTPSIPQIIVDLSICQWRSEFRIDVIGVDGYGIVQGRGRTYGSQTYIRGTRWSWVNGKSQTQNEEEVLRSECLGVFETELREIVEETLNRSPAVSPSLDRMHKAHILLHDIQMCLRNQKSLPRSFERRQ